MKDSNGYVDQNSPSSPNCLFAELKVEFEQIMLNIKEGIKEFSRTALRFATVYRMSPRMRFDITVNEFTKELALGEGVYRFWRAILETLLACKGFIQCNPGRVKCSRRSGLS
jgi:hypothetical protein